jgi:glycosyltransferase involved in cell wall biosynthesis
MTHSKKFAVAFINFGPYHLARLESLGRLAQTRGLEVWGLELCAGEADYPWEVDAPPTHFHRRTLFPDRRLSELTPLAQVCRMVSCLEALSPQALAVAGYSLPAMWAALAWAKLRRRPIVVMGDSTATDLPRIRWRETLKRWLVSRFDAALGGGAPQRAYFHALGVPEHCIFPGYDVVDNDHFSQNAQAARAQAETHRAALGLPASYFLSVSRFVSKKNLPGLLAAYARYRELSAAPWDLVLCGAGPEEARLRNQARALPGVHFAGFRQADALPTYYGLAKCFILPSSMNEPWGLVVNEAMAAGLPVLVSRACGCRRDLVTEGVNGFTFDPRDPEALARLMVTMASGNLNLNTMGAASRRIIARWTPATFAFNLLKAIDLAESRR